VREARDLCAELKGRRIEDQAKARIGVVEYERYSVLGAASEFASSRAVKLFQSFRLDSSNHCLWRADERLSLPPKAFDVLRYLVEHPGRLVTQDEILAAVWPETFVNPEVIKKYILGIRKALGDSHDKPVFIDTLPRRGYQFVAPVRDENNDVPLTFDAETMQRMVGRKAALVELNDSLKMALRGQRQLIFITGEAGIGKTTFIDVFHQKAARHSNLRIARGQCVEGFGGKEAYYPFWKHSVN